MTWGQEKRIPGHYQPGQVVKTTRCCYGLRDASRSLDAHLEGVLKGAGFSVGVHCPCLAFAGSVDRKDGQIHLLRHGDDII